MARGVAVWVVVVAVGLAATLVPQVSSNAVRRVLSMISNSEAAGARLRTILAETPQQRFVDCVTLQPQKGSAPCDRESIFLNVAIKELGRSGFQCGGCSVKEQELMNMVVSYLLQDPQQCARLLSELALNPAPCTQ